MLRITNHKGYKPCIPQSRNDNLLLPNLNYITYKVRWSRLVAQVWRLESQQVLREKGERERVAWGPLIGVASLNFIWVEERQENKSWWYIDKMMVYIYFKKCMVPLSCTVFIWYCDYLWTRAKWSQHPINTITSSHKAIRLQYWNWLWE